MHSARLFALITDLNCGKGTEGLTSKMSHGLLGRGSCLETIWILLLQFEQRYDSTRRDRAGRWLWRLVRRLGFRIRLNSAKSPTGIPNARHAGPQWCFATSTIRPT